MLCCVQFLGPKFILTLVIERVFCLVKMTNLTMPKTLSMTRIRINFGPRVMQNRESQVRIGAA